MDWSQARKLLKRANETFKRGDYEGASKLSRGLIATANQIEGEWNYGNVVHHSHRILGHIAFRKGDLEQAENHLLESARIPGSPQLNSFGPNMSLARSLVELGRTGAVIKYLKLCESFWSLERGRLSRWAVEIQQGSVPNFGANLLYGA